MSHNRDNTLLLMWMAGYVLIFTVYVTLLHNAFTIAGGDLGLSVSHAKDFYELAVKYTWSHFEELGRPNLGIVWYAYYTFINLLSSIINTKILTIIFFSMPLFISFSLIYFGVLEVLHNRILAFLGGLIFVFNPLSIQVYLMVPLHPTYSVMVYAAFFVYVYFLLMFSRDLRKWKLILATLIAWPFMLITFSNPAYGLPVTVAGLSLIILAIITMRNRLYANVKVLITCLVVLMILSIPFILTYPSLSSTKASKTLPTDVEYIVRYVKVESNAVKFFENFFPARGDLFTRILIILTSLLILSIAFIIPTINLRRLTWKYKVTYLLGTMLFIVGVLLSKGIKPPIEEVNELIYRAFAPYSFAFRSPFSKFPIVTIIGLTLAFIIALKSLEQNSSFSASRYLHKYKYTLKYLFIALLVAVQLLQAFIVLENNWSNELLLTECSDLEIFHSLEQLKHVLKDNERVIIFPINYGVFSTYNTSCGYYRGAANEWVLLERPVIINNNWDRNQYIKELLLSLKLNNKTELLKLTLLGNVKYFIYISFKKSDGRWNDYEMFNKIVKLLQAECYTINSIQICKSPLNSSYFYIVEGDYLEPLTYKYIDPTYWIVSANSSKPFTLVYTESYDPLWEARVYKDGTLVSKVKPTLIYDTVNGFWINETGNLTIVVRYIPQDWFELGLKISAATLALCVFYLVWDWMRCRGDRWALWLEKQVKSIPRYLWRSTSMRITHGSS